MRIHLISVGTRMPAWVNDAYHDFSKRLPHECSLVLQQIEAGKRGKNTDIKRLISGEGDRMLAAIPKNALCVALDVEGKQWSSETLADTLSEWMASGDDVALLVGGADGLAPACLQRVTVRWSLSKLTLPHMLVRVVLAEQVYRAWSIGRGLPYHRG